MEASGIERLPQVDDAGDSKRTPDLNNERNAAAESTRLCAGSGGESLKSPPATPDDELRALAKRCIDVGNVKRAMALLAMLDDDDTAADEGRAEVALRLGKGYPFSK